MFSSLLVAATYQCSEWNRTGHAAAVLEARNQTDSPSDITFWRAWQEKDWDWYQENHYDWWMFPWRADPRDSSTALEYSIDKGDGCELLDARGFVSNYNRSANCIFDALRIGGVDAVAGDYVSPARKPKVICSMRFFQIVAHLMGKDHYRDVFAALEKEAMRLYGSLPQESCNNHLPTASSSSLSTKFL